MKRSLRARLIVALTSLARDMPPSRCQKRWRLIREHTRRSATHRPDRRRDPSKKTS